MSRSGQQTEPVFFLGVPRSGTTAIFERFALHPQLAWISNYARISPNYPAVNLLRRVFDNRFIRLRGQKNQFGDRGWLNRYLPRPDESYEFWSAYACPQFSTNYLIGQTATTSEAERLRRALEKTMRYQGKNLIAAKLTGPARIGYLRSVWPNAVFVHIIRDGLDVVRSLLNVKFWKLGGGYDHPWWTGGLDDADISLWERLNLDPGALAAIQWRRIIQVAREEASELGKGQYIEISYESYCKQPREVIRRLHEQTNLDPNLADHVQTEIRNESYPQTWDKHYVSMLRECLEPILAETGYSSSGSSE